MEHKRREQAADEKIDKDDADDVFRHALRAHAANMAVHADLIAGVGPTQRQLPRKSSARVQYEDVSAAAAVHEYELEGDEDEGHGGDEGVASCRPPHVPTLRLPGAAAAHDDATPQLRGATQSTWAAARERSAPSPRHAASASSQATAAASAAGATAPAAAAVSSSATAAASAAASAAGIIADADCGDTLDVISAQPPPLPRTEQLLMALKKYTGATSSASASATHGTGTIRSTSLALTAAQQSPHASPRQASQALGDGSRDGCCPAPASPRAAAASSTTTASPLSPRPLTSPSTGGGPASSGGGCGKRGSLHGTTPPPPGYPSMPPSAAAAAAAATNVVSRSLTPRQMQQALATMANAGGTSAATTDAAALAPTRSAASFTAAAGGCRRPTLTQLFPECTAVGGGAAAVSSGLGELDGVARQLSSTAGGDDGAGPALRGASQSFSSPALRRLPQRRGSMVLLPSGGVASVVNSSSSSSQAALRPTLARATLARFARRSDTSGEMLNHPYSAFPADVMTSGRAGGGSGPASPVSPVKAGGLRAAAEALFTKVTRSAARGGGGGAGSQEWYFGADAAANQPPLSPSALRFASATGCPGGGAGAASSPFATAAAGVSSYVGRSGSSGLASPIANSNGTAPASANLFAGMASAAVVAGGAPSGGGGGGSVTSSLRARAAPPSPLQVTAAQSGEAWFVERTASALQAGASSANSPTARRLPTPSALSATPAVGGGSFASSAAASPCGSSAMPRLLPLLSQPPVASTATAPAPVMPPSPGGVAPLAATATAASTAAPVGPAATAAEGRDDAGCVSAPLQVLQPTPPPPTAARRGRVRASASCYVAVPGAAAEAYACAAFAQKPRSLDTGHNASPARAPVPKPPQPLPLMPPPHADLSAPPPAHLPSASSSASYDGRALSGSAAAATTATATVVASRPLGASSTQPLSPLLPDASPDETFAFQQRSGTLDETAGHVVQAPQPSQGPSGQHGRQASRAFAAPPPPTRAHAMTLLPGDNSSITSGSGCGPIPPLSPAAPAPAAAAPAVAAAAAVAATSSATAATAATAATTAAAASTEDVTSSLSNCAEVLESLSCWAGALCDVASATDRVVGSVLGAQSFGRTAWVARSCEESLGRVVGAAAVPLPTARRAAAEEIKWMLDGEEGKGEAAAAAGVGGGESSAPRHAPGAPAAATPPAATASNARSGIMSRMKRALLPGALTGGSSSSYR